MKKLLLVFSMLLFAAPVFADVWIKGHYNEEGDWVPGYWKTEPNGTTEDNYSDGAYNPHKPPPAKPSIPSKPNTDSSGINPYPSSGDDRGNNKIEIPRLDVPVPGIGDKKCKRTSIYEPMCP